MRGHLVAALGLALVAAQPARAGPRARFDPVGPADAKWTAGFWADRFETCRSATVPAMGRLMEGADRTHFLENFRVAAGLKEGRHRGPPWNDGDFYKWLEAASAVYAVTKDAALSRRIDEAVRIIAKAQREDGYLHTPVLIRNRNGDDGARPFADRLDFEMYNFGHLFTAACVHHRATGKKELLDVAVKAADHLGNVFRKPTKELARNGVCPSHYMGLIDLYRLTRQRKHLDLARALFEMRDLVEGGTDDNQDRLPFRRQAEAAGHAVRANYLYAGAADVCAEAGDATLLPPLLKLWESVATRKMYVTGACGALYDGASPDGSKDQKRIARTHQAYGRDYQLPSSTAHNETCAAVGNVLWNWRMLRLTGEARFADVMELALCNAVLAGVSLDGERFFYTNTLRQLDRMPADLRWPRTRQPFLSCYCCPPNVARTVAQAHTYAYGRSDNGVWVHLYGASALDTELPGGGRVKLTQETAYPWEGRVKISFQAAPAEALSLFLRVPGWAKGATLRVNGRAAEKEPQPGSYMELKRAWKAGDVVELDLPLRPRLIEAHPLVEEARNHVAARRGPLVYCLESTDLPKGATVQNVALPRGAKLAARFDRGLLGGVAVLEGDGETAADRPWSGELYREYRPAAPRPVALRLVPYYAWGNRGRSEMTVWLPLGR